jgi:hypothetical protein
MLIVVLCILLAVVLVFALIGINTRPLSVKSSKESAAVQPQIVNEPIQESMSAAREDIREASAPEMKETTSVKSQQSKQSKSDKMTDQDYRKALQQFHTEEQSKTEEEDVSAMNDSEYRNALRSMHDGHQK